MVGRPSLAHGGRPCRPAVGRGLRPFPAAGKGPPGASQAGVKRDRSTLAEVQQPTWLAISRVPPCRSVSALVTVRPVGTVRCRSGAVTAGSWTRPGAVIVMSKRARSTTHRWTGAPDRIFFSEAGCSEAGEYSVKAGSSGRVSGGYRADVGRMSGGCRSRSRRRFLAYSTKLRARSMTRGGSRNPMLSAASGLTTRPVALAGRTGICAGASPARMRKTRSPAWRPRS